MDKIRLATIAGMKTYLARRQIDKRVSFLSYFGDLVGDISSYHCTPSAPITASMLTTYSSYLLLSGATNITYVLPGLDLSGPFTIEGECGHSGTGSNALKICGHVFLVCGKYGCALGDNIASPPSLNTGYTNGYSHLAVTRNAAGKLCAYKNGILQNSMDNNTTNWGVGKTLTLNTNAEYMWRYLRIISGVCLGDGGNTFPAPTGKLTGFEPLGA